MISREVTLNYPDFTLPFDIYLDASDYQLGAVITQKGKHLAFYSRKLNKAQLNYTVTEKEMLSIVETLKEFRGILLGHEINVYTDHKNLTHDNSASTSQRAMRWRVLLEEFGPNIKYIKGIDNTVADALSRLSKEGTIPYFKSQGEHTSERKEMCFAMKLFTSLRRTKAIPLEEEPEEEPFPLQTESLAQHQQDDKNLQKLLLKEDNKFQQQKVMDKNLITYDGKLYVPKSLQSLTLNWFHHYLQHPGAT